MLSRALIVHCRKVSNSVLKKWSGQLENNYKTHFIHILTLLSLSPASQLTFALKYSQSMYAVEFYILPVGK